MLIHQDGPWSCHIVTNSLNHCKCGHWQLRSWYFWGISLCTLHVAGHCLDCWQSSQLPISSQCWSWQKLWRGRSLCVKCVFCFGLILILFVIVYHYIDCQQKEWQSSMWGSWWQVKSKMVAISCSTHKDTLVIDRSRRYQCLMAIMPSHLLSSAQAIVNSV